MNKIAFTIVAKNYIGLALVLKASIHRYNHNIKFFIFVADELSEDLDVDDCVIEAKSHLDIQTGRWLDMAFKYNITEFCTAIKPFCFTYLFEKYNCEKVIYFDPDCFVFNSLDSIYSVLDEKKVVLTPHMLYPCMENHKDRSLLQSGIFNLGFVALKKCESVDELLLWWSYKLQDYCYDDLPSYTFTDQKWMTLIPSLMPLSDIEILRSKGMNIAPWNFHERKVVCKGNQLYVERRQCRVCDNADLLVFAHFSGYDYPAILKGEVSRSRDSNNAGIEVDLNVIFNAYTDALLLQSADFERYYSLPYTYNVYDNGIPIDPMHRRMYRQLRDRNNDAFANPFKAAPESFYALLNKKGMCLNGGGAKHVVYKQAMGSKMKALNRLMKLAYRILGYKKYKQLLMFLKHASRYESQIFLLDDAYLENSFEIPNQYKLK